MERSFWIIAGPVVFLTFVVLFFPFVADDAFIVGRYALNFVEGHGLVYNPGEPVSALTSPLHALFVSGVALVSGDPVHLARLIMPVFPLLAWAVVVWRVRLSASQVGLVTAFGLASPFMALWTVGGLETPLLTLWMALFAAILARGWQRGSFSDTDAVMLGGLMGLAFLTRFDSILVTMPILLALAVANPRMRGVWIGAALALAIAAGWLVPAMLYYGDVLPTSYYVKMSSVAGLPSHSIYMTFNFVLISGLIFFLPIIWLARKATLSLSPLAIGVTLSMLLFTGYALLTSGKHMMFGFRFYVPYLLPMGLCLALLLPEAKRMQSMSIAVFMLSVFVGAAVHFGSLNPQPHRLLGLPHMEYHNVSPRQYRAFIEVLREDAQTLVADAERREIVDPSVFLFTGGTGYWMRDFYVYEVLVSYRHGCPLLPEDPILAADYVQQIEMVHFNPIYERIAEARHERAAASHIGATDIFFERDTYVRYLTSPPVLEFPMPKTINGTCQPGRLAELAPLN